MNRTIDYYNRNTRTYIEQTYHVDMQPIRDHFLKQLPAGGRILDLGCGSGRDSRVFLDRGFQVQAVDGSEEMCRAAGDVTGIRVICSTFADFIPDGGYDGIWACASLLHLPPREIHAVVERLSGFLRNGGTFYMSFKYGDFAGTADGRYYTYFREASLGDLLSDIRGLRPKEFLKTYDRMPGRGNLMWLNAFYTKASA